MKDNFIGSVGIWGCGSPVETSAEGRSTDRAGRRDQLTYFTVDDDVLRKAYRKELKLLIRDQYNKSKKLQRRKRLRS